jgi:hypothetical protein
VNRRLLTAGTALLLLAGCAPAARTPEVPLAASAPVAVPSPSVPSAAPRTVAPRSVPPSSARPVSPSPSRSAARPPAARSASFWGDTAAIPKAKNVLTVKVLNRTNGAYPDSKVFWSFAGQTHSIAERPTLDMPANSSGRMYFHLGSATGKYSDFIEFTVGPDQFNGNTTRVDAFALKIAMRLHAHDGFDQEVGESRRVFAESRSATFARFRAAVPAEFRHLAQGTDRILSPGGDPAFRSGGKYADYYAAFTKAASTSDILGCAGALSGKPDECARLNRHVTAAQAGQVGAYYRAAPANFYAKFWHDNAIDGRAYGFPYDDVNSQSTYVSHADPQYLLVAVGF